MIEQLLERLAEMFPSQDYQSRLEQYLKTKSITNIADAEYWANQYTYNNQGRSL